jgi:anaerobic selenocysteine-containing dehydrogenase
MEPPLTPWPEPALDEIAAQGLAQPRADRAGTDAFPLAGSIPHALTHAPYPIEVLFLYHTNPMYDDPAVLDWKAVLEGIPLVVSFSPYLAETSEHADLLLPDCTYLEKWFLEPLEPSLGYPAVGLGRPVVDPLYDTRNTAEVLIELGRALGGSLATAMPWDGFVGALQERVQGLYQAGIGMPSPSPDAGEGQGGGQTFEEFWAELQSRGVWYDQPYEFGQWERAFATPSGKFEFYSQNLKERLEALEIPFEDEDLLPRYLATRPRLLRETNPRIPSTCALSRWSPTPSVGGPTFLGFKKPTGCTCRKNGTTGWNSTRRPPTNWVSTMGT